MLRRTFLGILAAIPFWRKKSQNIYRLYQTSDNPPNGPTPIGVAVIPSGGYVTITNRDEHNTLTIIPLNGDNHIRLKMGESVQLS